MLWSVIRIKILDLSNVLRGFEFVVDFFSQIISFKMSA